MVLSWSSRAHAESGEVYILCLRSILYQAAAYRCCLIKVTWNLLDAPGLQAYLRASRMAWPVSSRTEELIICHHMLAREHRRTILVALLSHTASFSALCCMRTSSSSRISRTAIPLCGPFSYIEVAGASPAWFGCLVEVSRRPLDVCHCLLSCTTPREYMCRTVASHSVVEDDPKTKGGAYQCLCRS